MVVPCLNCTDRTINCHSKCKAYMAFKLWKDEENKKIRILKDNDNYFFKGIERSVKYKNKKKR